VRELANKFIFEFEASIRTTPGTLDARKKMAATARQYLASLAADSHGDAALNRELAESYYRLSEAEYATGETTAWLADLTKARGILRGLDDDRNGAPEQRSLYVTVLVNLQHYWLDRDPPKAVPYSVEAMQVAQAFRQRYPNHLLAWRSWVEANTLRGSTLFNIRQVSAALLYLQEAVHIADEAQRKFPDDIQLVALRVDAGNRLAVVTSQSGRWEDGLRALNETIAILDPLISSHPENPGWRKMRITLGISRATNMRKLAGANPAFEPQILPAFHDVYLMAKENSARNPGNHQALDMQVVTTQRYANQLSNAGQPAKALALLQEVDGPLAALVAREPDDHRTLNLRVEGLLSEIGYLNDLQRWRESAATIAQAKPLMDRIQAGWPDDTTTLDDRTALFAQETALDLQTGKTAEARALCEKGFQMAIRLLAMAKEEKNPVSMLSDLRTYAQKLGVPDPTTPKTAAAASAVH
jgi:tetratricopeptide (TPR) repeat protein